MVCKQVVRTSCVVLRYLFLVEGNAGRRTQTFPVAKVVYLIFGAQQIDGTVPSFMVRPPGMCPASLVHLAGALTVVLFRGDISGEGQYTLAEAASRIRRPWHVFQYLCSKYNSKL